MSQNVTLSERDRIHIERIKQMILEKKSQLDMARDLNLNRRTIIRKMQKWFKTEDFWNWLVQAWLDKFGKVDDTEAFRALTTLLGKRFAQKVEMTTEGKIEVTAPWLNKFLLQATTTCPTLDKQNSTSATPASES